MPFYRKVYYNEIGQHFSFKTGAITTLMLEMLRMVHNEKFQLFFVFVLWKLKHFKYYSQILQISKLIFYKFNVFTTTFRQNKKN